MYRVLFAAAAVAVVVDHSFDLWCCALFRRARIVDVVAVVVVVVIFPLICLVFFDFGLFTPLFFFSFFLFKLLLFHV